MNFFNRASRLFGISVSGKRLGKSDIRLSTFIESIHRDLVSINESFRLSYLNYIESFFYKVLSADKQTEIVNQLDQINNSIEQGDSVQAKTLLASLKAQINEQDSTNEVEYKPKVVKLDVPVFKNGSWQSEQFSMPLIALRPLSVPNITNCTITTQLEEVKQLGDEVYIKMQSSSERNKSKLNMRPTPELVMSIDPSSNNVEIDELISRYKKQLTEKSLINKS